MWGRRWWLFLVLAVYVLAFIVTSWVEVFGPAGMGLQIAWPTHAVSAVAENSPAQASQLESWRHDRYRRRTRDSKRYRLVYCTRRFPARSTDRNHR